MISISVFSKAIIKEEIGFIKLLAALLCIVGTMMIMRPNFLTDDIQQHLFSLLIIASGILAAMGVIIKQATAIRELKTSNLTG